MRKRRRIIRPTTLATMALIITLASLGFGYAAWDEQLTIGGTVETANMEVYWIDPPVSPAVACTDNDDTTTDWADTFVNRDVVDPQLVHLNVVNGYPGYQAKCNGLIWEVASDSIPVKGETLRINGVVVGSGVANEFDLNSDTVNDVEIRFFDGIGATTPPLGGGSDDIWVEVLSGAPSGSTLSFTGEIIFGPGVP